MTYEVLGRAQKSFELPRISTTRTTTPISSSIYAVKVFLFFFFFFCSVFPLLPPTVRWLIAPLRAPKYVAPKVNLAPQAPVVHIVKLRTPGL